MNAPVLQDFSYDPFDPAVMADPLPYYRVLRDEHPVYYIDKWDTYALSRFSDIWQVLEINDGTFVRVGGNTARRNGSGAAQRWAGARSAAAPDAVPRQLRRPDLRRCAALHVGPVPAEVRVHTRRPDPHPGQRAARRTVAARRVRPDAGVRRHRRGIGSVRNSRPARRSCPRGTCHRERGQPGAAGQRRRGRQRAAWLPRVPHPDRPAPPRRRSPMANCRSSTT